MSELRFNLQFNKEYDLSYYDEYALHTYKMRMFSEVKQAISDRLTSWLFENNFVEYKEEFNLYTQKFRITGTLNLNFVEPPRKYKRIILIEKNEL